MIKIDGSYGESGGQILRTSIALSVITKKPIHIFNIRKGRLHPGLKTQHLEGIKALADFCDAKLEGAKIGSTEIKFTPGNAFKKELNVKIPTAGSIGLLFQTLKIPLAYAEYPVTVNIDGGATFNKWAPQVLYTQNILLPLLEKMGYKAKIDIQRHGFYPVGGAKVKITVNPCKSFKPLKLEKSKTIKISGLSIASKHLEKAKVAERQKESVLKMLSTNYDIKIKTESVDSTCPGSGIVLWTETFGASGLGERGKPAEAVGKEAANELLKTLNSEASVDEHLCDQILPFLAIANGESIITTPKITAHTETNIWTIKQFLDVDFAVEKSGNVFKVVCSGS
ncbi:MAG: RNA 3'-terminal phosphate cyclase [Nanoarchaeota archaeon]|nr:RNA 3'-terminal phosphate cyclase [Nanoarchaeota archaeon]MBU2520015.1 RNA 3'-terminal phosphate cyclase [Nanoarchaeota archaeon]